MKSLVIETAFLGDAIISLALAEAIKNCNSDAEITYLVRPEAAELLAYAPAADRIVSYDKYGGESGLTGIKKKAGELNQYHFDVIFSLHTSKRTGLLLDKLHAARKIGYGEFATLTDKVAERTGIQRSARAVSLAAPIYHNIDLATLPKLDVSSVQIPVELPDAPLVSIAPGSVWMTKRWLPERFAEVANALDRIGHVIAFIGSPADRATMDEVRRHLTVPHIDLVGRTSISESAAVIARSRLLIANDSAPVHIATALRVPSVVLFGPTVKEFGFAPPAELGVICEKVGLWCRPCTSHGSAECPIHTHECMTNISVSEVLAETCLF